jgi:hypothetical protein
VAQNLLDSHIYSMVHFPMKYEAKPVAVPSLKLNPAFATHPQKAPATPLDSALTKTKDFNPFIMNTSRKSPEGGVRDLQSRLSTVWTSGVASARNLQLSTLDCRL